jgi:hypothetical protein
MAPDARRGQRLDVLRLSLYVPPSIKVSPKTGNCEIAAVSAASLVRADEDFTTTCKPDSRGQCRNGLAAGVFCAVAKLVGRTCDCRRRISSDPGLQMAPRELAVSGHSIYLETR